MKLIDDACATSAMLDKIDIVRTASTHLFFVVLKVATTAKIPRIAIIDPENLCKLSAKLFLKHLMKSSVQVAG